MTKHAVFLALSWVLALNVPHPGKPLGPRQTGTVGPLPGSVRAGLQAIKSYLQHYWTTANFSKAVAPVLTANCSIREVRSSCVLTAVVRVPCRGCERYLIVNLPCPMTNHAEYPFIRLLAISIISCLFDTGLSVFFLIICRNPLYILHINPLSTFDQCAAFLPFT